MTYKPNKRTCEALALITKWMRETNGNTDYGRSLISKFPKLSSKDVDYLWRQVAEVEL